MGAGTLRRYHKPLVQAGESTDSPVVAPGPTLTTEEAEAAAKANEAKLAEEQAAQAAAANGHPNTIAADVPGAEGENGAAPAESVNPIVQEAGGIEENPDDPFPATIPTLPPGERSEAGAEHDEVNVGVPVTPGTPEGEAEQRELEAEISTKHGDLERPSSTGSTADWTAYAEADPVPHGLDLTPRSGLRDLIAAHYLGAKQAD